MKTIEVVAAILSCQGKFLCVQKGETKYDYTSFKYEFPGGKVEPGESLDEALIRELEEELLITVAKPQFFLTIEHQYPDFYITMHSFIVPVKSFEITLTEHITSQWLSADQLSTLDWATADIPIVQKLKTIK